MYESPVETYVKEISHKVVEGFDEYTVKSINECGIRINRDELTRALFYDRNQYEKGYEDGYKDGKAEQKWIPCSERLPKEDTEVLISYRYKDGEGDTNHVDIDITTYGQMYFGGNKVGDHKHWRAPFEYFESNYEVVAWMPLPEPYEEVPCKDS